jgi:hypothetical protein
MSVAANKRAILAGKKGPRIRLRDGQNHVMRGAGLLDLLPWGNFGLPCGNDKIVGRGRSSFIIFQAKTGVKRNIATPMFSPLRCFIVSLA